MDDYGNEIVPTLPSTLLPCPFCGAPADEYSGPYESHGGYFASVSCSNKRCRVGPYVYEYDNAPNADGERIRQGAIKTWNTRTKC